MPKYVLTYHGEVGAMPEDPAAVEAVMQEWGAWYGAMGDAVVDGGAPFGMSKTVSASGIADDGGANPLSGYTVVKADNIEAACEMAKGCPMVVDGSGSVEVAPVHEM